MRPLKLCSEDGCYEKHHGRGLCKMHYHREYMKSYMAEYRKGDHKKRDKKKSQSRQKRTRIKCLNFDECGRWFMSSDKKKNRICPACKKGHNRQGFYNPVIHSVNILEMG